VTGHLHCYIRRAAMARDVVDRDLSILVQNRRHHSYRRFNPVLPMLNAVHVCECSDEADGPMSAHPQVADVIEEEDASRTAGIHRLTEQGSDDYVRASGLIHHGRSKTIMLLPESLKPGGKRVAAKIGAAAYHEPRGLASRVRIND